MTKIHDDNMIRDGRFFAVISYISFLCIITLILKKNNKFALYHAKQGLVLFVMEVAAFILSIIPLFGLLIGIFGYALFFLVSIWGLMQAALGVYCRIPVISDIAENVIL
ncbi:MAG: hypothetical protein PHW98_06110 [Candidatus Omnitrophica bacterium]|nr:hypothetical protein [Candidatus Omnitrophota bacterium]MDD5506279.1 hypothetical protein [Candidatus Omnitrophota bacterium]